MENIKYFLDKTNGFLFAYERSCEFFVRYISQTNAWEGCSFSFSNFVHDRDFAEITEDEALEKTGGHSPEDAYLKYVDMLKKNLS